MASVEPAILDVVEGDDSDGGSEPSSSCSSSGSGDSDGVPSDTTSVAPGAVSLSNCHEKMQDIRQLSELIDVFPQFHMSEQWKLSNKLNGDLLSQARPRF